MYPVSGVQIVGTEMCLSIIKTIFSSLFFPPHLLRSALHYLNAWNMFGKIRTHIPAWIGVIFIPKIRAREIIYHSSLVKRTS